MHVPIFDDDTFKTSFCRGAGICYYYNGEVNLNHKIFHLINENLLKMFVKMVVAFKINLRIHARLFRNILNHT